MRQEWRHLLFLHWPVAPAIVQRHLPPGLSVDTFRGRAYVGMVPFTVRGVRPPGLPALPLLSRFHEVNLRTYVHKGGAEPGVWFFSLDAASRLAVLGARALYRLAYHFARIRLDVDQGGPPARPISVRYEATRLWPGPAPATCGLRYTPGREPPTTARPGTLEHFLIERYVLYSGSSGRLQKARVAHRPYPLQRAAVEGLKETLTAAANLPGPRRTRLVHYSPGVSVRVFAPVPVST